MSREYTNKLIDLIDEGILMNEGILKEFLCYLSENDIKEFCLNSFAGEISNLFKDVEK